MTLRIGQVLVSEVHHSNPLSRLIAWRTGSRITHAMIYVGRNKVIEAVWPQVRWADLDSKIADWKTEDQAWAVLDLPGVKLNQRAEVQWQAMQSVGRIYDVGQLAIFALTGRFWHDGPGTQVCTRLVTASYAPVADLFDAETLAKNYPAHFPRLANLRAGAATPGDLLKSKLEVVDFVPSSTVRSIADFHTP